MEELEKDAASLYEDENVENMTEDLKKMSVAKKGETDASADCERNANVALDSDDTESENGSNSDSVDSDTDQTGSDGDDTSDDSIEEQNSHVDGSGKIEENSKFLKDSQENTGILGPITRLSNDGGKTDLCCCEVKGSNFYEKIEQTEFDEHHRETGVHQIPAQLKAKNSSSDET